MRVRFVYSAFFSLVAAAACFSACDVQQGTTSSVSSDLDTTRDYAARGPIWATAKNMRGRLDGATPINIQVHLEMHDVASAQAELAAISDPDNARYGQYLTSDAFAAKYGPTKEDVFTVRAYLEHNGLTVTEIPSNSAYIAATGTSAQVEHAFTTQMMSYETPDGMLHAPVAQALLPKTIAPYVHAVLGLASVGHARSPGQAREQATPIVTPVVPADCSHYYGENTTNADPPYGDYVYPFPTAPCSGISPAAMRHAYGIDELLDAGIDGHGQTIAFVDATLSPTLLADAQEYAQRNDPAYPLKTSQFTQVWGPGATQPTETYWYKEEGLDLEAIHAIAPKAKIVYVAAQSDADDDMVSALNLIVSENLASVVSNSWSDYWDEVGTSAASRAATPATRPSTTARRAPASPTFSPRSPRSAARPSRSIALAPRCSRSVGRPGSPPARRRTAAPRPTGSRAHPASSRRARAAARATTSTRNPRIKRASFPRRSPASMAASTASSRTSR
jgi:hypothetical protein